MSSYPRIKLYSRPYLDEILIDRKPAITEAVNHLAQHLLFQEDIQIVQQVEKPFLLDFPVLQFDEISTSTENRMIPAEYFPFSFNVFAGKSYSKDVILYHIPYEGNIDLLEHRPNPLSLSGRGAVYVDRSDRSLIIEVINFSNDSSEIDRSFQDQRRQIESTYGALKENVKAYHSNLRSFITNEINRYREQVNKTKNILSDLGMKEKKLKPVDTLHLSKNIKPINAVVPKDFDLAISFAGEDRNVAEVIAERLKALQYEIFYDKFQQANLWGKDLYVYLQEIYSSKARFCLMIISTHYVRKAWTSHERQASQAKAFGSASEYILPLRLDETEVPGLNKTVGFIDYNHTGIDGTIELLCEKLGPPTQHS